jgi:hypothetical protein
MKKIVSNTSPRGEFPCNNQKRFTAMKLKTKDFKFDYMDGE